MNKKEAADFLRISLATIKRLMKEKKIPYSKINGRVLFLKEELIKWVKSKRAK